MKEAKTLRASEASLQAQLAAQAAAASLPQASPAPSHNEVTGSRSGSMLDLFQHSSPGMSSAAGLEGADHLVMQLGALQAANVDLSAAKSAAEAECAHLR